MADTVYEVVASGSSSVSVVAPTENLRLIGFSVVETNSSASEVSIQEGVSSDIANELCAVTLAPGESAREWFGEHGIPCPGGIFLDRRAGESRAVIYYRVSDRGKDSFAPPSW